VRALARATALTYFQTAVRVSAPAFTAILFGGAVVFSKQGMHPRDLTSLARNSVPATCGLWGAWLLVVVPIVRAVVCAPGAGLLRSLPLSRAALLVSLTVGAIIPQLPWALLWARGEGLVAGVVATGLAVACALQIVAGVKTRRDALALLAAGCGQAPDLVIYVSHDQEFAEPLIRQFEKFFIGTIQFCLFHLKTYILQSVFQCCSSTSGG
jgi:hypothetical protein